MEHFPQSIVYIVAVITLICVTVTAATEHHKLKVLAVNFPPFAFIDKQTGVIDGVDVLILQTIANKYDFEYFLNWTDNLTQMNVSEHEKFDIIIGDSKLNTIKSTRFISSNSYSQTELIWCVGRAKPIARWKNLFFIFKDIETYIVGVFGFGGVAAAVFLTTAFEKKPLTGWTAVLVCLQHLVGNTSSFEAQKSTIRFLFMWGLIVSLLLNNFFLAFLLNFQARQFYDAQVDSVDEIIQNGYHLAGSEPLLRQLLNGFSFSDNQIRNYEICNEIDICLSRLVSDEKLAVGVSKQYIESKRIQNQIFCFDTIERIQVFHKSILIRDDLIFVAEINETIKNLFNSGIIFKWLKDLRMEKLVPVEEATMDDIFVGIVALIGAIMIIPFMVLYCEFVTFKKCRQKSPNHFWTYAEMLIDGERHLFVLDQNFV